MKIFRTLMTQYLVIILAAFALWPHSTGHLLFTDFLFNTEKYDIREINGNVE